MNYSVTIFVLSVSETCVFAYLGLAIFAIRHKFDVSLVVWSIVRCMLIGHCIDMFIFKVAVSDWKSI